jgi:hypothetical protein
VRNRLGTLRAWVVVVFTAMGLGLVPWAVWLGASLRPDHTTDRWDVVWTGFDLGLALAFSLTAVAAWRRSPWVGALAATSGTLLVVDAWFDIVLESHRGAMRVAVMEALFAELPVAALCYWLAYRTSRFLALAVNLARAEGLHLATAGQRSTEGDLIGVLEVAPHREPARQPGDSDATA